MAILSADLRQAALDVLAQARYEILLKTPYFQRLIISMPVVLTDEVRTTAVTRRRVMLINPLFITAQSPLQGAFCVLHEGLHIYGSFFARIDGRDPETANIAHDCVINQQLLDMGYEPPAGIKICLPENYGFPPGLTMEEYYDLLVAAGTPQESEESGVGGGQCGGGAGHSESEEVESELDKEVGRTDAEWQTVVERTSDDIRRYEHKFPGTVPGGLSWIVEAPTEKSRIPWQRKYRANTSRLFGQVQWGQTAFSRKRISKRSFLRNELIPGMVDYPIRLGIVLDTSGSMFDLLRSALREMVAICHGLGLTSIVLIQGDAGVADIKEVELRELLKLEIKGGGGTNFEPVIARARELRPKLDILTYVTDGAGNYGPEPKDLKVQWVILASAWSQRPPWGSVVVVRENGHEDDFLGLGD